jgi:hypothetical protein
MTPTIRPSNLSRDCGLFARRNPQITVMASFDVHGLIRSSSDLVTSGNRTFVLPSSAEEGQAMAREIPRHRRGGATGRCGNPQLSASRRNSMYSTGMNNACR